MLPWWVLMADYYSTGETFRAPDPAWKMIPANMVITMIPTMLSGNLTYSVTTALPITVPGGATHALLTVDIGGGDIRYWEDGSTPTTSAGLLVPAGGAAELTNLSNVKFISTCWHDRRQYLVQEVRLGVAGAAPTLALPLYIGRPRALGAVLVASAVAVSSTAIYLTTYDSGGGRRRARRTSGSTRTAVLVSITLRRSTTPTRKLAHGMRLTTPARRQTWCSSEAGPVTGT